MPYLELPAILYHVIVDSFATKLLLEQGKRASRIARQVAHLLDVGPRVHRGGPLPGELRCKRGKRRHERPAQRRGEYEVNVDATFGLQTSNPDSKLLGLLPAAIREARVMQVVVVEAEVVSAFGMAN